MSIRIDITKYIYIQHTCINIYFTGLNLGGVLTLLRNEGKSAMKLFSRVGEDMTYTDLKNNMEIVVEGEPGSNQRREQEKAAHAWDYFLKATACKYNQILAISNSTYTVVGNQTI